MFGNMTTVMRKKQPLSICLSYWLYRKMYFKPLKVFRDASLICIMIPFKICKLLKRWIWNETGTKSSLDTFEYTKCFPECFYASTWIGIIWAVICWCLKNSSINYIKGPFDVRSVRLQLKSDPKVYWGTQSIAFCYFKEASDPQRLFKSFWLCQNVYFNFFLQIRNEKFFYKKNKKNLKSDLIFVQSLKMISVCKTAIENQVFYHFKSISLTT